MIKRILLLLIVLILVGCNASKPVIVTKKGRNNQDSQSAATNPKAVSTNDVVSGYISQYKEVAMNNMKRYGIPASIILAQGILESGAGRGSLAINANNHFGIKCHNDWTGESVRQDDDTEQECFRKYSDPAESFKDHAVFLSGRNRYASLFDLPKGDYEAWARGLRAAGYATDPRYPEKLISYIERYNLQQFDKQVLGRNYVEKELKNTANARVQESFFYEVQKGDTLYSISKKFNVAIEDLRQINSLMDNSISVGQKLKVNKTEVRI